MKEGDKIEVKEKSKNQSRIKYSLKCTEKFGFPDWLSVDIKKMSAEIKYIPSKLDTGDNFNEQLVIEYYSR
jgi:small subunit ribosomal protein S4